MKNDINNPEYCYACYMKVGDQVVPVPELMTEEEAVIFLRLDTAGGPKNPRYTLRYYREQGLLRGTHVGKRIMYQRKEILRFLDIMTNLTAGEPTEPIPLNNPKKVEKMSGHRHKSGVSGMSAQKKTKAG